MRSGQLPTELETFVRLHSDCALVRSDLESTIFHLKLRIGTDKFDLTQKWRKAQENSLQLSFRTIELEENLRNRVDHHLKD